MTKQVKGRINTNPQYGCKIDGELVDTKAHFIAGDWSVVDNYHKSGYAPYIINYNPTGLCAGRFRTIKAGRNCVKELATLPCDSYIDENGVLQWETINQQLPAIKDAILRHSDFYPRLDR